MKLRRVLVKSSRFLLPVYMALGALCGNLLAHPYPVVQWAAITGILCLIANLMIHDAVQWIREDIQVNSTEAK